MDRKALSAANRIWPSVAAFGVLLLCGSTLAGLFGGASGFWWTLKHGASGPFAVALLHYGTLNAGDVVVALIAIGVLVLRALYATSWTLGVSVVAVLLWVIMGWGVGV